LSNLAGIVRESQDNYSLVKKKLSEVANLNSALQESLQEVSGIMLKGTLGEDTFKKSTGENKQNIEKKEGKIIGTSSQEGYKDKGKVDELKKQVEVILHSSQQQ
jgi:hypothetical protein